MDHIRVSDKTRKKVEKLLQLNEPSDLNNTLVVLLIVVIVALLGILLIL